MHRRGSRAARPRSRHPRPSFRQSFFERALERAIDGLPGPLRPILDELAIVVDDVPSLEQRRTAGLRAGEMLYGLYEGVPPTEYGADWTPFPNKITLFRQPLEEDFRDPIELAEEIRVTLIHELAHHAGFDEDRLEQLGMD
ncbi:MAG TPA: metallopeptidase family protein [Candidatus Acidoferrales bacterium]|nr:metallopeptidase family protein [Candidatus Acidoferrales bacterium]